MRRTRSVQKLTDALSTRLVRRLGNRCHTDDSHHKSSCAGSKRRSTEEETKGRSPCKRVKLEKSCTVDLTKIDGNLRGVALSTTCCRRPAGENNSDTSGSPVIKTCLQPQTGQSSSEEHIDSVNASLDQIDDTDTDSDVVVINKSRISNRRQATVERCSTGSNRRSVHTSKPIANHKTAAACKRVQLQNGVVVSEDDTADGQVISNEDEESSEDTEVTLRGLAVESCSRARSASTARNNMRIQQLEAELQQVKKTMRETVVKKNEVIERLQNHLKWKDEQIEGMNELVNRNMLLEAKLRETVGEKENDDIRKLQNINWKNKQIEGMKELSNRNVELEARINAMQGDKKNEVIQRLQNNLKWKDEQIEGMNELVNRNMELEAKIKEILGDKKAYKKEVENAERERIERETRKNVEHKESESPSTISRRPLSKSRTPSKDTRPASKDTIPPSKDTKPTSKDTRPLSKDMIPPSKDTRPPSKDTTSPSQDVRMPYKNTNAPTHRPPSKDTSRTSSKDANIPTYKTPSKDTRTSSKDKGTPTSKKGQRLTRHSLQRKGNNESGDMDGIDKLFIESDTEDTNIDNKDEQGQKIPGKGDKKKVVGKSKEEEEKHGNCDGRQEKVEEEPKNQEEEDENSQHKGRRHIHKLLKEQKLLGETKAAAKAEKVRRERLKKVHQQHLVVTEKDPKSKLPITTRLVLAFKTGTKTPLVEVNQRLIRKMKPHQVEAVEFLWDNLIESVDRLKSDDPGQGCILAHCMGLGKTLSVIGLVHTLLTSRAVNYKSCLVVCPLNTVLNWQHEWEKWLDKKDRFTVYELASSRNNHERVTKLQKWQTSGGVMIMGYQIFRILSSYSGRSKKSKTTFDETLIDPGPDMVVCDEGHILKNDASAISKCMNRIRTKKRVILTGTPLQNNLIEYHCMVSFVKPNLLGTRREFSNRFVNPITNGQHSDSTAADVRLMKRRAHVLHEMLDACVQRRDYSALTKFLPPKHEYVIAVRLSPLQVALYRKYMELHVQMGMDGNVVKGASLFSDYQNLMRIWTHPWVLRLDEIRQEKRAVYDSDDDPDLLETSEEEEMEEDEEEVATSSTGESSDRESGSDVSRHYKTQTCTSRTRSRKSSKPSGQNGSKEDDRESESDAPAGKKAKIVAGEVIRSWKSSSRGTKFDDGFASLQQRKEKLWWSSFVDEESHKNCVELSGKLVLLFHIVKLAEQLGDKVLLFSQSLLTLDLIEDILAFKTEETEKKAKGKGSRKTEKGETWVREEDYLRMDGATDPQQRKRYTNAFNDPKQKRLRLFLISTRAGGLGINLERANRVIIFDASWNPSHDIQSIFRVYRFGQTKPVYVYRFLAQGTMEEKIYERQVTKETLSQRVVDEHQIDRHFTAHDLQELYRFTPDQVDAPDRIQRPTPVVPKDVVLAELLSGSRDCIVQYHEHDSLLVNHPEEDLSEEERQAAWEEYEKEKQGLYSYRNMVMEFPGVSGRPPVIGPSAVPGIVPSTQPSTSALTNTTMQLLTTQHPKLNFQIAQLPRVVQEILKYNPNITAEELQSRLQAFLGMNARYSVPGHAMGASANPSMAVSQPAGDSSKVIKTTGPGRATAPSGLTVMPKVSLAGISGVNLPSRLPAPGKVPAMAHQK